MQRLAVDLYRSCDRFDATRSGMNDNRTAAHRDQCLLRWHMDRASYRCDGALWKGVVGWSIPYRCDRVPAVSIRSPTAIAGEPHPTGAIEIVPAAAVVWQPAPWVGRDPGIAVGGIVSPIA